MKCLNAGWQMEKDGKIATAILEGRAQLVDGEITVVLQDNPTDMAECVPVPLHVDPFSQKL